MGRFLPIPAHSPHTEAGGHGDAPLRKRKEHEDGQVPDHVAHHVQPDRSQTHVQKPPEDPTHTCRQDQHRVHAGQVHPGIGGASQGEPGPITQVLCEPSLEEGPPEKLLRRSDQQADQQADPQRGGARLEAVHRLDVSPGSIDHQWGQLVSHEEDAVQQRRGTDPDADLENQTTLEIVCQLPAPAGIGEPAHRQQERRVGAHPPPEIEPSQPACREQRDKDYHRQRRHARAEKSVGSGNQEELPDAAGDEDVQAHSARAHYAKRQVQLRGGAIQGKEIERVFGLAAGDSWPCIDRYPQNPAYRTMSLQSLTYILGPLQAAHFLYASLDCARLLSS